MKVALSRRTFGILPITDAVIADQQRIADTFKQLGLIPATIKVSDAVLKPSS
jgi:sulfonate transport system substrate-binding protein